VRVSLFWGERVQIIDRAVFECSRAAHHRSRWSRMRYRPDLTTRPPHRAVWHNWPSRLSAPGGGWWASRVRRVQADRHSARPYPRPHHRAFSRFSPCYLPGGNPSYSKLFQVEIHCFSGIKAKRKSPVFFIGFSVVIQDIVIPPLTPGSRAARRALRTRDISKTFPWFFSESTRKPSPVKPLP